MSFRRACSCWWAGPAPVVWAGPVPAGGRGVPQTGWRGGRCHRPRTLPAGRPVQAEVRGVCASRGVLSSWPVHPASAVTAPSLPAVPGVVRVLALKPAWPPCCVSFRCRDAFPGPSLMAPSGFIREVGFLCSPWDGVCCWSRPTFSALGLEGYSCPPARTSGAGGDGPQPVHGAGATGHLQTVLGDSLLGR